MTNAEPPYMLDTNVFNDVLDGKISPMALTGRRLLVIGVQAAELNATRNSERRAALRAVFEEISPSNERAASLLGVSKGPDGTKRIGMTGAVISKGCLLALLS